MNQPFQKSLTLATLLAVLCCTLLWNCTHEAINLATPQKAKTPYEISLDEAVLVAKKYKSTNNNSAKGAKIDAVNAASIQETINDENNRPLFHVVNYNKGGFVIVSADMRTMPILAYSGSGNSFDTKSAPLMNGLGIWFDSAKNQMKKIRNSTNDADSIVIKEWKKYLSSDVIAQKGARVGVNSMNTNTNCQAWYTTGQYMCHYSSYFSHNSANPNIPGPLFSYPDANGPNTYTGLAWGQSRIANLFAPPAQYPACSSSDNTNYYCGRYPAGCGPVAMAQVLWHYYRNDPTYASMPSSSYSNCGNTDPGALALGSLMIRCAGAASSSFGFAFTCNTLTFPGNIPGGLQAMGLSNGGTVDSFRPGVMESELYQGNPIILFATNSTPAITGFDRHIWVCDGFDEHDYSEYNCDTGRCDQWNYLYLYMNWGWDGSSNGWYACGNFSPTGSSDNFNLNVQMISGIRR